VKHTHMAVGMIPDDLVNLSVVLSWTPGSREYTVSVLDASGEYKEGYERQRDEPIGYDPDEMELDSYAFYALPNWGPRPVRLAQSLAGFGYFRWYAPAGMPSKARAEFEENAK
jgi:hypothetical protein